MKMTVSKNEFVLFILRFVNMKRNLITCRNVKMQKKDLAKFMTLEEEEEADLKDQQVLHEEWTLYANSYQTKCNPSMASL